MLHRMGYEHRCEDCLGHFREEDMAPFDAPICNECWENSTQIEREYFEERHHA